ncbi:MAG: NAD(P)/FAD-dependent oxidoreductase [bacterium]|nr:NAD(P)/FAD-dependent oxidoreductase [bacterium]
MREPMERASTHVDVVIIGAGISGIGSAWHLMHHCPSKSFTILEGREAIGGTWDLFRYPGVRSDSDMHTLGYAFKPWLEARAIADGPSILSYINETADEFDIRRHIRFGHRVTAASWSSSDAVWTIEAELGDTAVRLTCNILLLCGGYYDYEDPYRPTWDGEDLFSGNIVHPQFWPENLDCRGKRFAVIGSGATAMTLVPALAREGASRVVMVQRSPTYVVSWPSEDRVANLLARFLPNRLAYAITRRRNVRRDVEFYRRTRTEPDKVKAELIGLVRRALKPEIDVAKHFTPRYGPWDQRLCLIPDDDLYDALNSGKATVRTDTIARFTHEGLELGSGETVEADIIVVATGLRMKILNGIRLSVDGSAVNPPEHWSYKGMMLSDVPNLVQTFGYINASWTLRADLTAAWACRLINTMDRRGARKATPRLDGAYRNMTPRPWIDDFPAGYVLRALDFLPRQGNRDPWRNTQDYALDVRLVKRSPIEDGALELVGTR